MGGIFFLHMSNDFFGAAKFKFGHFLSSHASYPHP